MPRRLKSDAQPPGRVCPSSTRTSSPAAAERAAAVSPPIPEPTTTMSCTRATIVRLGPPPAAGRPEDQAQHGAQCDVPQHRLGEVDGPVQRRDRAAPDGGMDAVDDQDERPEGGVL